MLLGLGFETGEFKMSASGWPELEWGAWSKTAETLHMWTQIVG